MEHELPLIAWAYLAFAAGLILGFSGSVWLPVFAGGVGVLLCAVWRTPAAAGLMTMLLAAGVIAVATPARDKRAFQPRGAESGVLAAMRGRASRSIDRIFAGDAAMARALLIADQRRIAPEMRDAYARSGMIHMLSISGLHVAIIAGAVLLALRAARLGRRAASALSVAVTGFYVAMIGAPAPAVRSAVMLGMVALSTGLQRPTSPWAALAVGAFIPLFEPRTVLDLGYQLSVIGIAGLIASASLKRRLLARRMSGWRLGLTANLLTSVIATVVTAPIVAWYFGRVSLIGPLSNLAAGPVIAVLQPLLFLALALAPAEPLGRFFADAAHPLLAVFDAIARSAAAIPGSSIPVVPSIVTVAAGGAAVACLLVACVSRYPARPAVAGGAFLALVIWAPALPVPHSGNMEMHVLDVGQGDAILVRTDRGRWIIFDAGRAWRTGDAGRATIIPYVRSRGGPVAAFILSHAHADHVGGAVSVIRSLRPAVFWDSAFPQGSAIYDRTLRATRDAGVEWRRVHAGDTTRVDGVLVSFLAPDSAWTASLSDPNEASTIALLEYGSTRFLLVGDAEQAEESWLLARARDELRADVLKVGHHGSSTSSGDAFLRAVSPRLAIISVGADNLYGHPSADVLAALGRAGARTVRTDVSGTVVVRSDGRRLMLIAGGEKWDVSGE